MHTFRLTTCALALVTVWGCGGSNNPDTVPVAGTVTYKGNPVEGATVVFGASSGGGHAATGLTDAAGKFQLTTFRTNDGAVPGNYTVAISKTETTGGMTAEEEHAAINAGKKVTEAKTTSLLPKKYAAGPTSGLTREVTLDGPNDFTFDLTD